MEHQYVRAMGQEIAERIPDVHKIAVLRANALGDFIFTLPALEALRAAYPNAEIVLLAKAWHAAFLANRPSPIDRVVVIPAYGGVSEEPGIEENPLELERFFKAMQREHFDLAFQLHGGGNHSNPFTQQLGARMTIGLKAPDAVPLDRWIPYIYFQHEILRYLEVVSLAGATTTMLEPHISVTRQDLLEGSRIVPEGNKPLVALHPGASDPGRRWAVENFAAVGDALASAGAQVVVTGTADERDLVDDVVNAMQAEALGLGGCLSLSGLAGLLSRCRVVVANDTGPLHLARAVGAATVGIYWCFNLVNMGPITRSRHRLAVSWQLICPICGTDRSRTHCPHQASFVNTISTDEVIGSALDLLASGIDRADKTAVQYVREVGSIH
ncbi:MAG: glycosyltransferase family 9 protein [Chloroflexi bacterium]|nr:glycosyltransferase family 9 protein [Chloroflexota bacterium]